MTTCCCSTLHLHWLLFCSSTISLWWVQYAYSLELAPPPKSCYILWLYIFVNKKNNICFRCFYWEIHDMYQVHFYTVDTSSLQLFFTLTGWISTFGPSPNWRGPVLLLVVLVVDHWLIDSIYPAAFWTDCRFSGKLRCKMLPYHICQMSTLWFLSLFIDI